MDELLFAELQRDNCWFTLSFFEDLPQVDATGHNAIKRAWADDACIQRHIFAMIFGGFGYSVNLFKAKMYCELKIIEFGKSEPENRFFEDANFLSWLNRYAQYCVLYGTILAYQHDYVRAARYLMNGLKTGAINLFMPYCDFIRYVLSKVEEMPAEIAEYSGCGFSVDEPMGSIDLNEGYLLASTANDVIPALEGEQGGIILAYNGTTSYGNLRRLGSTSSEKFRNRIDIYEVLMVDSSNKLKKLRLYFNGYFSIQNRNRIRLPSGFRLDICSRAARAYTVVAE